MSRTMSRWSALGVFAAMFAACALSGCGKKTPEEQAAGATPAQQTQAPASGVSAQVAAMGTDALREAAGKALAEQRLYAPAGNNAMEFYVAMRTRAPNDAAAASALSDLMPYALIATEQSIAREDFSEAQRLYALIQQADPQAPALPRLKQGIADAQAALAKRTADSELADEEQAQAQAELERQRLLEQQRAQQQAADQLPPQPATTQPNTAPTRVAVAPAPTTRQEPTASANEPAAPTRAQPEAAPPQTAPAQASTPAPAPSASAPASAAIRAVSTPSPAYPPAALRDQQSGEVVVEFTVNPDGSVSNPRVVSSKPARVFDRATLNAVRRWRFQPIAEATTTRRTIAFNPNG